jgi:hypothetical protein
MHVTKRTSWASAEQAVLFRTKIRPISAKPLSDVRDRFVMCAATCAAACVASNYDNFRALLMTIYMKIDLAICDTSFTH